MQRLKEKTQVLSVVFTESQVRWVDENAGDRKRSEFIRELLDKAIASHGVSGALKESLVDLRRQSSQMMMEIIEEQKEDIRQLERLLGRKLGD